MRTTLSLSLVFFFVLLSSPRAEAGLAPIAKWVGSYLLDKAVDDVWDRVSGKPSLPLLENRLQELEASLSKSNAGLAQAIRELRGKMRPDSSYEDYFGYVVAAIGNLDTQIKALERRVGEHDKKLKELEDRVSSLEVSELVTGLRFGVGVSATESGLVVRSVLPDSPATRTRVGLQNASIEPGDVIQSINGRRIHTIADFAIAIDRSQREMQFTVLSGKKLYVCAVTLRY